MNIFEAFLYIQQILKKTKIDNPRLESLIMLKHILKKDEVFILTNPNYCIHKNEISSIECMLKKRLEGLPIAYITHEKEFMGLKFYVNENVLIPRPETELLVEETISLIKSYNLKIALDLCTGSGCIAISIEKNTNISVIASDISFKALKVAAINKKILNSSVNLINANLLEPFTHFDIIVTNPPYIRKSEYNFLQPEVKKEPKLALLCDENYLLIHKIINQSQQISKFLVMEISLQEVEFLKKYPSLSYIKKDYSQNDRIAVFSF